VNSAKSLIIESFSVVLVSLALTAVGCEENQLGLLDNKGNPPFTSDAVITPDTINIDTLTPVSGTYMISATIRAKASDLDGQGDLQSVTAQVFRPTSGSAFSEQPLRDDGVAPDQAANDSIFSGSVQFTLIRAQAGPYRIQISARDSRGFLSNSLVPTFFATRNNSAPRLDTLSLVAPDTVNRPSTGSLLIFMSIAAADSDGLADISEVYFRNLSSIVDPNAKNFLLDDGGIIQKSGITSGDLLAGDGVFSIIIQLPSSVTPGLRQFAFQAADTFRDTSASFIHNLLVQ